MLSTVEIVVTDLGEVVGFHIVIEVAPDVFLQLVVALLGIGKGCLLILAQPLLPTFLQAF